MDEFIELKGLEILFAILSATHNKTTRRSKHFEIESEALKILRMIANHHVAITEPLYQQNYLNILIQSLDSPVLMARTASIDFLLAIVTLEYPSGHQLVMKALSHFQTTRKNARVFDPLIEALSQAVTSRGIFGSQVGASTDFSSLLSSLTNGFEKPKPATDREIREFLVSMVALIRFVVEVPDEYEYRMYLRNEFYASGVRPIFQKLKSWATLEFHAILQHVEAFEDMATSDFEYLVHNLDTEVDFDINDASKIVQVLEKNLPENDFVGIRSVLQHLLIGTTMMDPDSRSKMLSIIDKVVTRMVLDQNGLQDFKATFQYAIDDIIGGLAELERVEEECSRLRSICDLQERQLADTKRQPLEGSQSVIPLIELEEHHSQLEKIWKYLSLDKSVSLPSVTSILPAPVIHVIGDDFVKATESISNDTLSTINAKMVEETTPSGPSSIPMPPPAPCIAINGQLIPPPPAPPSFGNAPPPPPFNSKPLFPIIPSKYRTNQKLKKLHWDQVPHTAVTDEKTIWSSILRENDKLDDILFDKGVFTKLETLFVSKPTTTRTKTVSKKPEGEIEENAGKIVDEKRAQNILIFLGTLRQVTPVTLANALRSFDDSCLNDTILGQSLASIPDETEIKLLKPVQTHVLRKAETFMIQLMNIYRVTPRVQSMIFISSFHEHYSAVKMDIMTFHVALKSIMDSKSLKKVFGLILSVGNYMNSAAGKAPGFKLALLEKLANVKANSTTNESVSALHVIIELMNTHLPDTLEFIKELEPLRSATSLSLSHIQELHAELRSGYSLLSKELTMLDGYSSSPFYTPLDDAFITRAKESHEAISPKMEFISRQVKDLSDDAHRVLVYFGEDISLSTSTPIETYIAILDKFAKLVESTSISIKQQAEKKRKQDESKFEIKPKKKEDTGAMDSLLDKLKSRPITSDIGHSLQKTPRRREPAHQKVNHALLSKPIPEVDRDSTVTLTDRSSFSKPPVPKPQQMEPAESFSTLKEDEMRLPSAAPMLPLFQRKTSLSTFGETAQSILDTLNLDF